METAVKKSDFVLAPYMKSSDLRATYQLLNTLIPYFFLWFLAALLHKRYEIEVKYRDSAPLSL
jgi:hypothetical protein